MSHERSRRDRDFSPLRDKTLVNVLRQLFRDEFGYQKKMIFAELMIDRILDTVEAFVKSASMMEPGQVLWMAVPNGDNNYARRPMGKTPQVPVVLTLVSDDDLKALVNGEDYADVRRQRHTRLLKETHAQGGVLAQTDLSALTLTSERVVGRDIADVQEEEGCLLPTRGALHDLGPTTTHKVAVIRLYEAGYLEPEIARKLSPVHSLHSVERYVQTYKNVKKLCQGGFSLNDIASILDIGKSLVAAYVELLTDHHPAVLADNPYLQDHAAPSASPTT